MLQFFITPIGMNAALAEIAAIPSSVDKGKEALWAIAPQVEQLAKDLAPYRTGALRDSIHCVKTKEGLALYSDLEYAYWQEYGFRHKSGKWIPGKFFMTNAINSYVTTKETDNKILDKIEHEAHQKGLAMAAGGVASGMMGLAALFGLASFMLMGFSALMSGISQ